MKKINILLALILCLTFVTCKKDIEPDMPKVTISKIDATANNVIISGTYEYSMEVTSFEILYSDNENMTLVQSKKITPEGNTFNITIEDLNSNTTYYYCFQFSSKYNSAKTEKKNFKTLEGKPEDPETINGYAYVDLGLPSGLLWATCNVGASSPEDYGNYYAWGEISPKAEYTSENNLTYGLSISVLQSQGIIDGNHNLTPSHDAATANWGGNWRMPTRAEQQELLDNCKWIAQNSVNGYKVTGPNGNSIFLPAAGYRDGSSLYDAGEYGYYSSSTPGESAYSLYFLSGNQSVDWGSRYGGQSVRPVSGENNSEPTVQLPTVTTNDVSNISTNSAICGGNVTSDGNAAVTARGVCWSTSQNPTISNSHTADGNGTGSFTSNITGLTANTTYYVRAYATNEKGTSYGEEKSFETVVGITMPTVTTNNVTNITTSSAVCGGNVTSDGNATVIARGICWSETQNPSLNNIYSEETNDGSGTGTFTSQLSNLKENTTYYVRAYATNEKGTSYGEQKEFTTLDPPTINGYEYVDLGLPSGLKWATCNVGADSPEDYGDYFAWGETNTKAEYTEENSLTYDLTETQLQAQGIIDGEGNLTPQHDAAAANWGGSWRMPAKEEIQELVDNCTWEWTEVNGVNGSKVTGPNGSCIFLPAAGDRYGASLGNDGSRGNYWSSTLGGYFGDGAYLLDFSNGGEGVGWSSILFNGLTVRPISE